MSVKEEKGYRRVDLENGDNYEGGFATVSPRRERMIVKAIDGHTALHHLSLSPLPSPDPLP